MNYTYNISQIDNTTSLTGFFVNINEQTNGYPFIASLILVWFATFVYLGSRNLDSLEASMGANFITLVISSLAYFAGFFGLYMPVIFFTLLIITVIIKSFQ